LGSLVIRGLVVILSVVLLSGCGKSGPASTRTNSSQIQSLQERIDFLHKYVTFRRTYETLDFDIMYQNNGGIPPGPSDCDIRLIATVPATELQAWVPQGAQITTQATDQDWLKSVPTTVDLSGVNEWYSQGRRTVGIDRLRRIVVYRLLVY
jgi:hypothetical protein